MSGLRHPFDFPMHYSLPCRPCIATLPAQAHVFAVSYNEHALGHAIMDLPPVTDWQQLQQWSARILFALLALALLSYAVD